MKILGMVGTAIPSITGLVAVILSASTFPGKIGCGFYPIITSVAMARCRWLVFVERKRVKSAIQKTERSAYIRIAGGFVESW